jgi:DNA-directed RNA polymerase II subunit RPB1
VYETITQVYTSSPPTHEHIPKFSKTASQFYGPSTTADKPPSKIYYPSTPPYQPTSKTYDISSPKYETTSHTYIPSTTSYEPTSHTYTSSTPDHKQTTDNIVVSPRFIGKVTSIMNIFILHQKKHIHKKV